MVNSLTIKNFKSLKNLSFDFKNLNVITGINGVGKSSLIQTLLLFRQSYLKGNKIGLSLDGELTGNLGSVKDILNSNPESYVIEIVINNEEFTFDTSKNLDETILVGKLKFKELKKNALFSKDRFQYISASRISPESQFKKSSFDIENKQFGKTGEYAVSYIAEKGKRLSDKTDSFKYKSLVNLAVGDNNEILPLENQINYWLNYVANEVRLGIQKTTNTKYELNFEFFNGESWDSYSANNSAFGLTYALPIITALLAASPGDIVIIENPESDLHPYAQSKIGELIARASNENVQIFVETHSDHILNGIRLAVSNRPTFLSYEKAKVFYFYKEDNQAFTKVESIEIDQYGRLPIKELKLKGITGFFDQIDNDYMRLFRNQNG